MTDPDPDAIAPPPAHPSLVGPTALWLAVQLAALALSASRVPFFAPKRFPHAGETLALGVMLLTQFTGSALFFPLLMRTFTTAVFTVAAALPFTIVAGFFAGDYDRFQMSATCGYVVAWLVGLALWRSLLRSPRAQATGVALALLAVLAGPLGWYLRGEFRVASSAVDWTELSLWGPYLGVLHVASIDRYAPRPWLLIAAHLAVAAVAALIGGVVRHRRA